MKQLILWEPTFAIPDKPTLIKNVIAYLAGQDLIVGQTAAIAAINQRESLGNTLIAPNLAIPHVKSSAIKQAVLLFVKLTDTLTDWQVGAQVDRYIFTLIPENCAISDLAALKDFYIRIANDQAIKALSGGNQAEVQKLIQTEED